MVNGERRDVDAPDDMPLLWVLRDLLNLTGTKYGCGIGACRACTVHVNGVPTPPCRLPISTLAAADIVTIEGLPEAEKEPLVAAWVEEDVPQCGSRWRSVSEAAVARLDGAQALSFCVTGTPR